MAELSDRVALAREQYCYNILASFVAGCLDGGLIELARETLDKRSSELFLDRERVIARAREFCAGRGTDLIAKL